MPLRVVVNMENGDIIKKAEDESKRKWIKEKGFVCLEKQIRRILKCSKTVKDSKCLNAARIVKVDVATTPHAHGWFIQNVLLKMYHPTFPTSWSQPHPTPPNNSLATFLLTFYL